MSAIELLRTKVTPSFLWDIGKRISPILFAYINFIEKCNIAFDDAPKNKGGLIKLIMMGKSIGSLGIGILCQFWVGLAVCTSLSSHENSTSLLIAPPKEEKGIISFLSDLDKDLDCGTAYLFKLSVLI